MNARAETASPVPVEVLTDEELAVLQAVPALVVTPHLSSLPDSERSTALRTAYRCLLARGIVHPPTAQAAAASAATSTVEVDVRDDVRHVVAMRAAARSVMCVARTTAIGEDFWYAHLVSDVILVEHVTSDGLHRFALADATSLHDLLVDVAVHPETTDSAGPTYTVADPAQPPPEVVEVLAGAALRTDVVVRRAGDEHRVLTGLFTGPRGAWLMSARHAEGKPVVVRPRTRADLLRHLGGLIEGLRSDEPGEAR